MASKRTHVSVSVATKARLDREIERLVAASRRGANSVEEPEASNNPHYKGMSYDALINRLLDLDERKRERGRESAARRREVTPDPFVNVDGSPAEG